MLTLRTLIVLVLTLINGLAVVAQDKGVFQAGINYPAGPPTSSTNTGILSGGVSPLEIHVGDFNGDGKPDLIAAATCAPGPLPACPASGSIVVVYLSNGDGTYQPGIITGLPAPFIRSINVGDFNGDGKLDVAAAMDALSNQDTSSGSLAILLGNGDGTFTTGPDYPLGGIVSQANAVTTGDLNRDGRADVVVGMVCAPVASPCQGAVAVYVGNGDGSFQSPGLYPTATGSNATPPVIGDFNRDGNPDVAVASGSSASGATMLFFPGKGDGTLGTPASTALPTAGFTISAGDFNSDGNLDIATAGYGSVMVAFGNGDGTFQTPVVYNLAYLGATIYANSIVSADMNGDGKLDLIAGGYGATTYAALLLNDGTGNFSNTTTFPLGGSAEPASAAVTDSNGDGKPDILMAISTWGNGSEGALGVLLGNGDGTMQSAHYLTESTYVNGMSVAAADFNGDGIPDLIYPSNCSSNSGPCSGSGFTLLLGSGSGGYQAPITFTAPVQAQQTYQLVAAGDFNGDGRPDVAVFNTCDASCSQTSVSIFLNAGNGNFQAPVVYEGIGATPLSMVTGDFNGDGKTDLALLAYCASGSCDGEWAVGILLGNGDGTFGSIVASPLESGIVAWWLAAADLNGDGLTDIVVAEQNASVSDNNDEHAEAAQIFLSNGDGTFRSSGVYSSGGDDQGAVTTGDINGDGKMDIVLANLCEPLINDENCARGSIGVLLGVGDGTFSSGPVLTLLPGVNTYGISLADVNGDGKLDTVVATNTGVAVAYGNGDGSFQSPTVYVGGLSGNGSAVPNSQLAIADLDGNGSLDIVQPSINGQQLAILYNQGNGISGSMTSLQSSPNPAVYGQTVTVAATVTPSSGVPTGSVAFTDNGAPIGSASVVNGSAVLALSDLGVGTHSFVAAYSGDSHNTPSTSSTLQEIVNEASTAVSLTSSANPSYVNQSITFTATVTSQGGGSVSGTVTFKQGTSTLATVPYSGGAQYTTTYDAKGSHSITAVYSGDSDDLGGTSAALLQVVNALPAATKTTVTTSGSPSYINQPITVLAKVSSTYGPIPDGEAVTFYEGGTSIGSGATSAGTATFSTSTLTAGTHTIKAVYAGDSTFKASSGTVQQTVTLYPSTIILILNPNASTYGQSVLLSATVASNAPGGPTGNVVFKTGTVPLGTATLSAGSAALATAKLPAGSLMITASYKGDMQSAASSGTAPQTVSQATTTVALASSRNPSKAGQTVKFTATVTSPTTTATGSVIFADGNVILGTVNLAGGRAVYSTSSLSVGSHDISATYDGTANISGSSTSQPLVQVVN